MSAMFVYVGGEQDFTVEADDLGVVTIRWADDGLRHETWMDADDLVAALQELRVIPRQDRRSSRALERWRRHAATEDNERAHIRVHAAIRRERNRAAARPSRTPRYIYAARAQGSEWVEQADGRLRRVVHDGLRRRLGVYVARRERVEAVWGPLRRVQPAWPYYRDGRGRIWRDWSESGSLAVWADGRWEHQPGSDLDLLISRFGPVEMISPPVALRGVRQ